MRYQNIAQLLRSQAERKSQKIVYRFVGVHKNKEEHINFRELEHASGRLAFQLRQHVCRGDRVILLYSPGFDFIKAFYACLCAGLVAVPVSPVKSGERWEHFLKVLDDCQATLICTSREGEATLQSLIDAKPYSRNVTTLVTSDLEYAEQNTLYEYDLPPDELAFLQYTSGSTGSPKGVCISHANLLHNLETIKTATELNDDSVCSSWLPIFHDMGLIWGVLIPVYAGVTSVLMSSFTFLRDPGIWFRMISKYRVSHSGAPNFAYDLCVRRLKLDELTELDLSCWTLAFCGAEMIRAATIEEFTRKFSAIGFSRNAFYPCYGMAEATLMVSAERVDQPPLIETLDLAEKEQGKAVLADQNSRGRTTRLVSVGRAIDCEIKIVDQNTRVEMDEGEIGEIWIKGNGISRGYWQKAELLQQTFCAEPAQQAGKYFRSGDMGYIRNRQLFISGRLKEMIILQARNYYPTDIERVIQKAHPALRLNCGAAFSIDTGQREILVVVQEVSRGQLPGLSHEYLEGEIRYALAKHLDIELGDLVLIRQGTLPFTTSGKIQRLKVRTQYLTKQLIPVRFESEIALA